MIKIIFRGNINVYRLLIFLAFTRVIFLDAQTPELHNWTHFRGDHLDGIAAGIGYTVNWNDSLNIDWFTSVPGKGWSSPVIWQEQVWITSASEDGKEMFAICLDRASGDEIMKVDLFRPENIFRIHAVNSYATPTPAIEEDFLYVHFGRYGTACIETKTGSVVWKRTDMECEHVQGPGSSLLLYEDKLIVHMEGTDVQEIYALDKRTGKTIWKVQRDKTFYDLIPEIGKKAYVTPIVIEVEGRRLLVTNGSAVCNAFDIDTGEEVWYIVQGEDSTISMPFVFGDLIYFYTSFVTSHEGEKYCELWAVDPKGSGDLSDNIRWRIKSPILQLLTPVVFDGLIYTVNTRGVLQCIDALSGRVIWTHGLKGKFNASPVYANGSIYLTSTRGETYIFKTGTKFALVAENHLPGEVWATPAFVDGAIFLRTSEGLFCINKKN